jgi:hypothetical protein
VDIFTESGMRMLGKSLAARAQKAGALPPTVDGSSAPEIKKQRPAPRQKADNKQSSNVEIHIHGNVSGSNILIGNDNEVTNTNENQKDK